MSINITSLKRNDKCYCASGKKYKTCCLVKDELFYSKYCEQDVIILHDMAFVEDHFSDEEYGDGRVSVSQDDDKKAKAEIGHYFNDQAELRHDESLTNLQRLRDLIAKYPKDPVLYNLLYIGYHQLDDKEKSSAVLAETLEKFPLYFYGRVSLAQQCFFNKNLHGIFEAFNKSYTLRQLYPHREVFNVEEGRVFHCLMSFYSITTNNCSVTEHQGDAFTKLTDIFHDDYDEPDHLTKEFMAFFMAFYAASCIDRCDEQAI